MGWVAVSLAGNSSGRSALRCWLARSQLPARAAAAPAAGGTRGAGAPRIPPAPTRRSAGEFCSRELRAYSTLQGRCNLTQRGLEFMRWPFRLASEQVSVQGTEG